MKKLIMILFLFVFSICMFSGCSEEAESSQNETKYITVGQQQKGTEIFNDFSKDNILKMILRTYDTTCYELTDEESLEIAKDALFNSEYIEIENPWLEGGIFLEIYSSGRMHELTVNTDVIYYKNKTYQILFKSLYEQLLNTFEECTTKEETAVTKTLDSFSNPVQNADISNTNEDKNWSEQDITSMFSHVQEPDWEYVDCILIPDHASDRIGAILFWNNKNNTSNVAFFDANGCYQQCGTYAKTPAEPDFTYLGDGAVTFKLETENGTIYNYTLTISIDGNIVNFIAEDDLPK